MSCTHEREVVGVVLRKTKLEWPIDERKVVGVTHGKSRLVTVEWTESHLVSAVDLLSHNNYDMAKEQW